MEVRLMSGNNYLKFMTEEFVKYYNDPKDVRKKKREAEKLERSAYLNRWFGVLPFTLKMFIKNR